MHGLKDVTRLHDKPDFQSDFLYQFGEKVRDVK